MHVRDQNAEKILVAEFDGNRFHGDRPVQWRICIYMQGCTDFT